MIRVRKSIVALLAAISAFAGDAGADNLIYNGSFEMGNYDRAGFVRVFPGDTRVTGWKVGGIAVDWHVGTDNPAVNPFFTGANFGPAKDGSLVMDLNLDGWGSGTIEQRVYVMPNHTYDVSFHMAASEWFTQPRAVLVEVIGSNGAVIGSHTFHTLGSAQYDMQWERFEFPFVSNSPGYSYVTLRFSSPDDSGFWGPLLDDVQVHSTDPTRPFVESSSARVTPQGLEWMRVNFSERLDLARGAESPSTYRIVSAGRDRRFGTSDDTVYAVSSVRNVNGPIGVPIMEITPATVVPMTHPLRVTVLRTGIFDLYGNSMAADFIRDFITGPRPR